MKAARGIKVMGVFMLIGILTMGLMFVNRIQLEDDNMQVDIVLDYDEFAEMATQSDLSLEEWFEYLQEQGIQRVALKEESFNSLVKSDKPLKVTMMGNLLKEVNWEVEYPSAFVASVNEDTSIYDVVAYTDSEEVYQFITNGLQERYPADRYAFFEEAGHYAVVIHGTIHDALFTERESLLEATGDAFTSQVNLASSKLAGLGFGFDPEKIEKIQQSGLEVLPRPYSYGDWSTAKQVEATWTEYEKYGIDPSIYIFDSNQVLGFPDELDLVAEHMRQNEIRTGLIETPVQRGHSEQEGLDLLTDAVRYQGVRIYSLQTYVQERYQYQGYSGAEEIENTLYRAVTERNVRLLYLKPFKYDTFRYVTIPDAYGLMLDNFEGRIAEHGMTLGESSTFEPNHIRVRYLVLMSWGVAAAAVLLFSMLFNLKEKYQLILLALGLVAAPAMVLVMPSMADKILAIGASVTFASLSMVYFLRKTYQLSQRAENIKGFKRFLEVGTAVLVTACISLVGAGYVATILSDIKYLLEMDIYRGVNISQYIPFFFFLLFYLKHFGYKRKEEPPNQAVGILGELKRLLLEDVKVLYLIIAAFVGVAGYIYVSRIGHESNVQATQLEILLRNMLENLFIARPRLKEFLIGIPALTLGMYVARKKSKLLIFAAGFTAVLGQTSIINTFSHLRTPLYMSVSRTVIGLIIGFMIGWIAIFMLELLYKLIDHTRRKIESHPLSFKG